MLQARSLGALAWNMMGEEPAEEKRNPERTSPLPCLPHSMLVGLSPGLGHLPPGNRSQLCKSTFPCRWHGS